MILHKHVNVLLDKYGMIVQVNVNLSVEIKISLITPPQIPFVITQKFQLLQAKENVTLGVQMMQTQQTLIGLVVQVPLSYAENVNPITTQIKVMVIVQLNVVLVMKVMIPQNNVMLFVLMKISLITPP